ncbi:hypothetical protein BGZ94_008404 [Podila epigama]|nr:hypothetical protein BGZ94_008404 [Podila epigama]
MGGSPRRSPVVAKLVMKPFESIPEKSYDLVRGINVIGNSRKADISIKAKFLQSFHMQIDCQGSVASIKDMSEPTLDGAPTSQSKLKRLNAAGTIVTDTMVRHVWYEFPPHAKVIVANLMTFIREPLESPDPPTTDQKNIADITIRKSNSTVGISTQATMKQGTGHNENKKPDKTVSPGRTKIALSAPQLAISSSSRVPLGDFRERSNIQCDRHILQDLNVTSTLDTRLLEREDKQEFVREDTLSELDHNVPDDELCTLSMRETTESYWSFVDSSTEEVEGNNFIPRGPKKLPVQVPERLLPPELIMPPARIPNKEDAAGPDAERSGERL